MPAELVLPPLAPDEIHAWSIATTASDEEVERLLSLLSANEQHRAARMRHPHDQRVFVAGRARTRQILGAYVGQPGHRLDVVARVDDKPMLAAAPPWFDFSFSRCDGLHVCAVGCDRRIGIDVEAIGGGDDADAIAATYFSAEEAAWLASLPADRRPLAFAGLWTKKEAFVKAVGAGLGLPLTAFSVPLEGDGLIAVPSGVTRGQRPYTVRTFTPADGLVGAVAAEGTWRLTPLTYPV